MSRVLVISNGPVPAMPGFKIEGSGQRCWGLATGLEQNGQQVTLAVRDYYPVNKVSDTGKINIVNWSPGKKLVNLANGFDVVIVSYSMGKVAAVLAKKLAPAVTLVLDCYVPIYVELSARKSHDKEQALSNYLIDHEYFNSTIKRGDYFLCANEAQRHFYTGVISALGVLNPYTYHENRIIELPFGISRIRSGDDSNPYLKLGITKEEFTLLWFGGLYPWFDIAVLLGAVYELQSNNVKINLVIVGGKNPYNNNPEFTAQYEKAVSFCKEKDILNNGVYFIDWVDYDSRIQWYKHAAAVININNPGKENEYSWRTRLMDTVWGGVPLITNGGDPISEHLIRQEAAIPIESTSKDYLIRFLTQIVKDGANTLTDTRTKLAQVRKDFYWDELVKPLVETIHNNPNPFLDEQKFKNTISLKIKKTRFANGRFGSAARRAKSAARNLAKNGRRQK